MVLPDGLEFLKPGWWLIHVLAVLLIWSYAYRKGRLDERKERQDQRPGQAAPGATQDSIAKDSEEEGREHQPAG
jgi:hypothetical protein